MSLNSGEVQFAEEVHPLRAEHAKDLRAALKSHVLTADVNRLYPFYLQHIADVDLTFDMELWNNPAHPFKPRESFQA